ncbi:potassium channel family protein [Chlorogloeopsis sp. ULAP01]|uniref:potassium channel family protein n=1 Tax=Chlorogloeopsis sp. ULAP01 TaxID=3056483 RepID=UPI0025AACF25|nr:potassium channel family protein [Chlorogloeopsis sp. ULAP01]MDM9380618.1 potassium channel family protein [Chlorogloeopsis sp. ULAP01]
MSSFIPSHKQALEKERNEILQQLEEWLEIPMLVLAFVWLGLFVMELIWGLNPLLEVFSTTIWIIFIFDFLLEMTLSPRKLPYLKRNWITVVSLFLPALRIFRIVKVLQTLQTVRAVQGLRLLRVMTSTNRGMRALSATFNRRGFGYVVVLTVIVTLVGSAGMYAFENQLPDGSGLNNYGTALWWTAMLMTTMGSEYWPKTPEGRVLCFFLALYAFAIFGYVTATLATFFIGRDADDDQAEVAGVKSITALHDEIAALRAEIQQLLERDS